MRKNNSQKNLNTDYTKYSELQTSVGYIFIM